MAKKKRAKAAPAGPAARPAGEADTEARDTGVAADADVDADVERAGAAPSSGAQDAEASDSSLAASDGSVESLEPAAPRVDIEHGDGDGAADVERGPM